MKNKAKINYVVDLLIGVSFLVSLASGLVLLFAGAGGYQGGRNASYAESLVLFSRSIWKSVHDLSSIIVGLGALGHLILHWNWIVCMTKSIFKRNKPQRCEL